jgi:nucleoside-diphosphate-sugar epimerase
MSNRIKIFITGTSGFIGTHLVKRAQQEGFEIYALLRKTSSTKYPENVTIVYGDINDEHSLLKIFSDFSNGGVKLDYIIHAAALTKSNSKKAFFETNYVGTEKLINALKKSNINPKKIIFLSSLAASGPTKANGQILLSQKKPITLYGHSKLLAEGLIINSGIPYIIIRPTAVYGPGEKDLFTVFKFINNGINPVLGSHPQELTFIYVNDLVKLILSAVESEVKDEIYFASDGNIYNKHSLSNAVSKALDKEATNIRFPLIIVRIAAFLSQYSHAWIGKVSPLNLEKYNELVAESWNCEMTKTIHHFNFQPKYNLEYGVYDTVKWYKENKWI